MAARAARVMSAARLREGRLWLLLPASQVLTVLACLAGLGAGFLIATLGAALTCFDVCPTPDNYFTRLGSGSLSLLAPCLALEALALAAFVAYRVATREPRRAIKPLLVLALGGLIASIAFIALMTQGQTTLPVTSEGSLAEDSVTQWGSFWGVAMMAVVGALSIMQWVVLFGMRWLGRRL
jgi:hypothetical protein